MAISLTEAKLPKGYKWSDRNVIEKNSPYASKHGSTTFAPYGKYCLFYPIGSDLYIKGMFHKFDHDKRRIVNVVAKLSDYKSLTAIEAIDLLELATASQGMIMEVWHDLGLPLGLVQPCLKPLCEPVCQPLFEEA